MPFGKVITFTPERGFGFIAPDDRGAADVFVHITNVGNADDLQVGDRVSFEITTDARSGKPRADKVRVL